MAEYPGQDPVGRGIAEPDEGCLPLQDLKRREHVPRVRALHVQVADLAEITLEPGLQAQRKQARKTLQSVPRRGGLVEDAGQKGGSLLLPAGFDGFSGFKQEADQRRAGMGRLRRPDWGQVVQN